MKLKLFGIIYLTCISFLANAQTIRSCAAMHVLDKQLAENPGLRDILDSNEQNYRQYADRRNAERTSSETPSATVTIPVVVHVLYTQSVENISDAQIASQITALNRDYSAGNSDISTVPSTFTNVVGNPNIQFALAKRAPDGSLTNGIERISTTKSSFDSDLDDAKFTSKGGADAWPRDKYLNLWVVPSIVSGSDVTLGYAAFPGGPATNDGVVIGYLYFGTMGTAKPPFNMGRTGTHEIGHWFNLYHTFQDGCAGTSSSTCISAGDNVCDTPPTKQANFQCPSTQNTCTETPTDQNDMTMNYMDYVNDNCMYMFSSGQVTRMRATLDGTRSAIKTSDALSDPSNTVRDASLTEITDPDGIICSGSVSPVIKIANYGSETITTIKIGYTLDNTTEQFITYTGSVVQNAIVNITLPGLAGLSTGNHILAVEIILVNGVADDNANNNKVSSTFTIETPQQLPFYESFTTDIATNNLWTVSNPDNSNTWTAASLNDTTPHNHCIVMENYNYDNGSVDAIISQPISIYPATTLQFDVAYQLYTEITTTAENFSDTLIVSYSDDCGNTYHPLYTKAGRDLTTATPYFSSTKFVPADSEWRTETIDLSAMAGKNIILVFENISDNENMLYLDEIKVTTTTGVNDKLIDKKSLSLYPNPGKSDFTISSHQNIQILRVSDMTGREIFSANPQATKYQFNLENVNAGIYLVTVGFGDSEQVLKLVVE